jgi:hypothetical protein
MMPETSSGKISSEAERAELLRCRELFEQAFDELHALVLQKINTPGQFIGGHHDYPSMSTLDSGFPHFTEAGFFNGNAPRDYLGTMTAGGIAGALLGRQPDKDSAPRGEAFRNFIATSRLGERLRHGDSIPVWFLDSMLDDAVERYLHLYGQGPIDSRRRDQIIRPMLRGVLAKVLPLRLIVPIALTHFELARFALSDSSYIVRLPRPLQLARSRLTNRGTGAVSMVVGAATHAFVSKGWTIEGDTVWEVRESVSHISANVRNAIDDFFASLRLATGYSTGYAQVVWAPVNWTLNYFCDLPPVYGATIRQYPSNLDEWGWVGERPKVTKSQLLDVRRIYRAVAANQSQAIAIGLKRLNSALTRDDAADALLDATIGLEVLLGDSENQALSYKLRLRAGALAMLPGSTRKSVDVFRDVKRVYEARSAIVHGLSRKGTKKAEEPEDQRYSSERELAAALLRFVLDVLLENPTYQSPAKIDELLLLRDGPREMPE